MTLELRTTHQSEPIDIARTIIGPRLTPRWLARLSLKRAGSNFYPRETVVAYIITP